MFLSTRHRLCTGGSTTSTSPRYWHTLGITTSLVIWPVSLNSRSANTRSAKTGSTSARSAKTWSTNARSAKTWSANARPAKTWPANARSAKTSWSTVSNRPIVNTGTSVSSTWTVTSTYWSSITTKACCAGLARTVLSMSSVSGTWKIFNYLLRYNIVIIILILYQLLLNRKHTNIFWEITKVCGSNEVINYSFKFFNIMTNKIS